MALHRNDKFELTGRIGLGNALLASTSAELFMCNINSSAKFIKEAGIRKTKDKWIDAGIKGALCFVCDNNGCFHFMIFKKTDFSELFSATLSNSTELKSLSDNFLYYESEEGLVGFNIIDVEEAASFVEVVSSRLPAKRKTSVKQKRPSKIGFSMFGKSNSKKIGRSTKTSTGSKKWRKSKKKALYAPEDLSPEWKKFFKSNGLKKKDFKRPEIQEKIRKILEEQNISLDPPPKMSLAQAKRIYKEKEDFEKYKKYSMEQTAYDREMMKYEEELRCFNQQLTNSPEVSSESVNLFHTAREKKNQAFPQPKPILPPRRRQPFFPVLPPVEKDALEQEVDDFFDDDLFNSRKELKVLDNMEELAENENMNPTFTQMLVSKKMELKPVTTLPDIGTMKQEDREPLLESVRKRLQSRRMGLCEIDESDTESDWSID